MSAAERPFAPAPLGEPTSPELLPLLSPENSGVRACGVMQKARGGLERTFRDHKKDGWSTRLLVLTDSHLVYYKQLKAPEDDGPLFWGVGSSLRAGEFIFGQERGRMPLANADVYAEKASATPAAERGNGRRQHPPPGHAVNRASSLPHPGTSTSECPSPVPPYPRSTNGSTSP